MSFTELGGEVGLTKTFYIELVRKLEREGYIRGDTTLFDKQQVKLGLVVFVQLRVNRNSTQNFENFRLGIQKLNAVQACYVVTGTFDFLAKARVRDMAADRDYLEGSLISVPDVQELCRSIAALVSITMTPAKLLKLTFRVP